MAWRISMGKSWAGMQYLPEGTQHKRRLNTRPPYHRWAVNGISGRWQIRQDGAACGLIASGAKCAAVASKASIRVAVKHTGSIIAPQSSAGSPVGPHF